MFIRKRDIILAALPIILSTLVVALALIAATYFLLLRREFDYHKATAERMAHHFYEDHFTYRIKKTLLQVENILYLNSEAWHTTTGIIQEQSLIKGLVEGKPEFSEFKILDVSGYPELKLTRRNNRMLPDWDFTSEAESKGFVMATTGKFFISPVFVWHAAKHVEIAAPIRDAHGGIVKVQTAKVNLEKLWQETAGHYPRSFNSYLVDGSGELIVYPERSLTYQIKNISNLPTIQDFLLGQPSSFSRYTMYETLGGKRVVGLYASIPETDWAVVVERSAREVYKPLNILIFVGSVIILFSFGGYLSWVVLSTTIDSSMERLLDCAEKIGKSRGVGHRLQVKSNDIFGRLAEEFNHTLGLLEERNKEIYHTNEEMKLLLNTFTTLVQEVSYDNSIEGVLANTLEKAIEITGASGGEVFIFNEESQEMMPLISDRLDKDFFLATKAIQFKRGVGLPGRVYEEGEAVYSEDITKEIDFLRKKIATEKGYISAVYVPLKLREKVYGCIGVFQKEKKDYSYKLIGTLEAMGTIAASFLESAQHCKAIEEKTQQVRQKLEDLRVITEIDKSILLSINKPEELFEGVAYLMRRLIPCDRVSVVLVDKLRGGFIYCYGWGTKVRNKGDFVPFEHTNISTVLKAKKCVVRNDLRQEKELLQLDRKLLEEGFLSDLRVPIILQDEVIGVLGIGSKRVAGVGVENIPLVEAVCNQLAVAFSHIRLIQRLRNSLFDTVKCLGEVIDAKSPWTKGHSERVAEFAVAIAKELGLKEEGMERFAPILTEEKESGLGETDVELVRIAALLHDIGKIAVPDGILDKPGKLTPEEWASVREHCAKGAQIISPINGFKELIPPILYHHEHYDGRGYPEGKKGEEIPLYTRIIAVADAIEAMHSERSYRQALSIEEIGRELKENSGSQFCPRVVEAALRVLEGQTKV